MKENNDGNDTNVGSMENSIEEDIEELKRLLYRNELSQYGKRKLINYYEQQEKDYKRVLKENEQLRTEVNSLKKENEELNYKLHSKKIALEIYNRYIPKSKVEDIIEELKINLVNMQGEELLIYESKIDILQELLRESEE